MTKKFVRKIQKVFAVVSLFALLLQNVASFSKLSFAQEATESAQTEVSPSPTIESSSEPSVSPGVEPTASPSLEPSANPSIEPSPSASPSVDPSPITDNQPTTDPSISPQPVEQVCLTNEQISDSVNNDWEVNTQDNWAQTKDKVKLGVNYIFPLNNSVKVSFKCLPKDEGLRQSLKIQQIKASDLKLPQETKVNGDFVWDITTGMADGTFSYDVVLPKPENKEEVKVAYIEKSFEDLKGQTITQDEVQTVESTKLYEEKSSVKATSLDHFTIFLVSGGSDYTYNSGFQPLTVSEVNALKYDDNIRMSNDVEWPNDSFDNYDYLTFRFPVGSSHYGKSTLTIDFQRDTMTGDIRVQFWDGHDWNDHEHVWPFLQNTDQTFTLDVSDYINDKKDDIYFDFRFQAYGVNYSLIDYISLDAQAWDRSSLSFDGCYGCQGDCQSVKAKVCNVGDRDMDGTTTWELYYSPSGNPKTGTVVATGIVNALDHGHCQTLTYDPQGVEGNYMYKVYQRPGHPGTGELWSNQCNIHGCSGSVKVNKKVDEAGNGNYSGGNARANELGFSWTLDSETTPRLMGTTASGVTAGNHSVSETLASGFQFTGWYADGTCHSCNNPEGTTLPVNISVRNGQTTTITLCNKIVNNGTISGYKWEDVNGNKIWDSGEPALANWEIFIDSNKNYFYNSGEPKTTTNASGYWEFTNLVPADYWIGEILQSGWSQSVPYYTLGHSNFQLTLSAGGNLTNNNFGNYKQGSISGYKWNDLNGDGVWQQPIEPSTGMGNLRIRVWKEVAPGQYSQACDSFVYPNGYYECGGLMPGTYWVYEYNIPSGWVQTFPGSQAPVDQWGNRLQGPFVLTSGSSATANFGNTQLGSIDGFKYEDNDGDLATTGDRQGVYPWGINLYSCSPDFNSCSLISNGQVDITGYYVFANLLPGLYKVEEVVQPGWTNLNPTFANITLNSGDQIQNDFINFKLGGISGYKFNDLNSNGIWDQDEPTINGWQICINLVSGSGEANCTRTDENGFYQFTGLSYGEYHLTEETRDGWHQSIQPANVLVISGTVSQDNNFGNFSDPRLNLNKTNDRAGQTLHTGDIVTFTITLTNNGSGPSYNTRIQDVQPVADYFEYLKDSGQLTKPDNSVVAISATGSNPYFWAIGDVLPGETFTLTYQLKVLKDSISLTHTNIANAEGLNGSEQPIYSNTATSSFNIGVSVPTGGFSGAVTEEHVGGVLGAQTGTILGAATGSPTGWLMLAIVLVGLGSSVKLYRKLKIKN